MDLRYPVGQFECPTEITAHQRDLWIDELDAAPSAMRNAVQGLNDSQLDTPYRPGGWTVRQMVHHLADSHLNCYKRFKLGLTEDTPTIRPYDQDAWAALPDSQEPIDVSLELIDALHRRWVALLRQIEEPDWKRAFIHPESCETLTLETNLGAYAWHSRHHIAHITGLREREGW